MAQLGAMGLDTGAYATCVLDVAFSWDVSANPVRCISPSDSGAVSRREHWLSVSGVITDDLGVPCARTVLVLQRNGAGSGKLLGAGTSDAATGVYAIAVDYAGEVMRIVLDNDLPPLLNDLVDRIVLE